MGDFNTPHDSVHVDALRRSHHHAALDTPARGWAGTWPMPVPVLGLDHILVGSGLSVDACGFGTAWPRSDHRFPIADIRPRSPRTP